MLNAVRREINTKFVRLDLHYLYSQILSLAANKTECYPIDPRRARFGLEDLLEGQLRRSLKDAHTIKE